MVGHETTAGSLNFTLLDLARNPEVQQKLREEIQTFGQDLDYDNVQKLEYLDAVVREGCVYFLDPACKISNLNRHLAYRLTHLQSPSSPCCAPY